MAARASAFDLSANSRSRGFGSMCSLGSHEESSSLARENLGCRERVVKASAHESVKDGDCREFSAGLLIPLDADLLWLLLLLLVVVIGGLRD